MLHRPQAQRSHVAKTAEGATASAQRLGRLKRQSELVVEQVVHAGKCVPRFVFHALYTFNFENITINIHAQDKTDRQTDILKIISIQF